MQERTPPFSLGEFLTVTIVAFALPIYSSIDGMFAAPQESLAMADRGLVGIVMFELLIMALLIPTLLVRGWRPGDLGLGFRWSDIGMGCLLAILCWLSAYPIYWLLDAFGLAENPVNAGMHAGMLSISAVVLLSVINPIFEELFVCAYVIRALERTRSRMFAVNVSVALRASYHLYQGAIGGLVLIGFGLILGWYFARSGRLWPAIIAHALLDLLALGVYT